MIEIPNQLLVTTGGNIVSLFLLLGGGIFVIAQNWRGPVNRLFFFLTFTTFLYMLFFTIASLQVDEGRAYFWWFLNVVDVFITMAVVHLVFRVINRHTEWRWFIIFTYASGAAIFIAALLLPHEFLPQVTPKMYFPYYLNAGPLYVAMLVHFFVLAFVAFVNLALAYMQSGGIEKRRYEYFILMLMIGYGIGALNFLLVFDIPVDPIFGMFVGFYFIPIAYGIFSSQLMDIRLVLRRAFYYALSIGAISAFLSILIFLNSFIVASVPWFQIWFVPVAASVIALVIGRTVWVQARDTDRLKYEFITVAAHKLRTPLTRIRWIIPQLLEQTTDQKVVDGLTQIDIANTRLIELTNVLLEAAHTEDTSLTYVRDTIDWKRLITEAVDRFKVQMVDKKLDVFVSIDENLPRIMGDARRLTSVVEIFIENAIMYTPVTGTMQVAAAKTPHGIKVSVTDTGIGVNAEDRQHIFSSFFRTAAAKLTDTEGVGLGLSIAKSIIERHGGKIGIESPGAGQGSTFWFTLRA